MKVDALTRHELDRRVVRTKKSIKTALLGLMEERDISSITISELTRCAGINRRTFYTHYRCITDIVDEIECEMVAALKEIMLKIDAEDIRGSAYRVFMELDEIVSVEFDYYFRRVRMDMRGVFMTRMRGVAAELAAKLTQSSMKLSEEMAGAASAYIVGGFCNAFLEWRGHTEKTPVERAANLAGILAESSLKGIMGEAK